MRAGHEHAAVAEPARVEDRGDLADDLLLAQRGHALEHRRLVAADRLGQRRVGPFDERQLGLDAIQQLRVEVVHQPGSYPRSRRSRGHRRSPPRPTVGYSACAPVECFPLLLVLATVAVGATGCFSSKVANTTITGEITVGQGSTAQTVNPATAGGTGTTTSTTSTRTTTTLTTSSGERRRPRRRRPAAAPGADVAAGKTAFTATCGGCHTLKDAGTNGNVGPNLDSLAPLTAERVAKQIANGGKVMPPKLLTGKDAANVAAYVASVAGK